MNKKLKQEVDKIELYFFLIGLQNIFNKLDFDKYNCNKIFEEILNEQFFEIEVLLQKHINNLKNE